jgi:hypothetical protein
MLRVLGGVLSLVGFATLMTTRGPQGEPSVLERIPAIMDALGARVAARKAGASSPGAIAELPSQAALPEPYASIPGSPLIDEPSPPAVPAVRADGPTWRLPSDAGEVKVNRGLP